MVLTKHGASFFIFVHMQDSRTMKEDIENEMKEYLTGLNMIKEKRTSEEKPGTCTKIAQAIVQELQKPTIDECAAPWAGPALENIFAKLKSMPVPAEKLLAVVPTKKIEKQRRFTSTKKKKTHGHYKSHGQAKFTGRKNGLGHTVSRWWFR